MDNDDDVGIVMRKTGRRRLAGRRLFSFEDEDDDDDDALGGDDKDESIRGVGDAFDRLGIKVRSPGEIEDGNSSDEEVDEKDEAATNGRTKKHDA
jgi:hypothetical protein